MLLEKSECLPVPLYYPAQVPVTPGSVHGKGYLLGLVKAREGAEAGAGLLWTVAWSLPHTPLACPLYSEKSPASPALRVAAGKAQISGTGQTTPWLPAACRVTMKRPTLSFSELVRQFCEYGVLSSRLLTNKSRS